MISFLITAGGTREPIDPVRYLSNYSSGKMGYALAEKARAKGHRVLLISAPSNEIPPQGIDLIHTTTAQEMWEAVKENLSQQDIAIHCAAVCDYRPLSYEPQKMKKGKQEEILKLKLNPDILADCRDIFKFKGTLIGFAAESENIIKNAQKKYQEKKCNLIIANHIASKGIGFNEEENQVTLITEEEIQDLPKMRKKKLADILIDVSLKIHQENLERKRKI